MMFDLEYFLEVVPSKLPDGHVRREAREARLDSFCFKSTGGIDYIGPG